MNNKVGRNAALVTALASALQRAISGKSMRRQTDFRDKRSVEVDLQSAGQSQTVALIDSTSTGAG